MTSKAIITKRLYSILKEKIALDVANLLKKFIKQDRHYNIDEQVLSLLNLRLLEMPEKFEVKDFPKLKEYCEKRGVECTTLKIKHDVIIKAKPKIINDIYKQLKRQNPNVSKSKSVVAKTKQKETKASTKEKKSRATRPVETKPVKKNAPKPKKNAPKSKQTARLFDSQKLVENESQSDDEGQYPSISDDDNQTVEETKEIEEPKKEIQTPMSGKNHIEESLPKWMMW
jgi:hypothetical protein